MSQIHGTLCRAERGKVEQSDALARALAVEVTLGDSLSMDVAAAETKGETMGARDAASVEDVAREDSEGKRAAVGIVPAAMRAQRRHQR